MSRRNSLWSDEARTRHFVLPADTNLPTGSFVLRTVTGKQRQVDPDAVAPFEVSQQEAKDWVKAEFGLVLGQAKTALADALRPLQEPRHRPPRRRRPAPSGEEGGQSGSVLALFAALTGEPVERLRSDPEAVTRGLRRLTDEFGAIVGDATALEETRLDTAKDRVRGLRAALNRHGIPVSAKVEALPDLLRQIQRAAEAPEQRAASAAALDALAQGIEEAAGKAAEGLRRLADEFRTDPAPAGPNVADAGQRSDRSGNTKGDK